jgi:quinol-cytochrome oxidoreductase complex cytochrome b subunit
MASLFKTIQNHLVDYPSPMNINYWWGFGSLAGMCLVIQILTGLFLAMHYTPHVLLAFNSVEHIMRDVVYGWLLRYMHANGASMFFIVVYLHIARGLFYNSYLQPRQFVWISGIVIFLLMMATAFMGYVLPWGQMSFRGATVITNMFSAIPLIGSNIVEWLWGGFSVDNATLNRFFALHFVLPFIIAFLAIIHLALLHFKGSNNPVGVKISSEKISFYPYFYIKDLFGLLIFLFFFFYFLFFNPNKFGHPDNYIPANAMVTPAHIVPEWYFLPFYAISRAIPNKFGGVICMLASILCLLVLPFYSPGLIRSNLFNFYNKIIFYLFCLNFCLLMWLGGQPIITPYPEIALVSTVYYFVYLLFLLPLSNYFLKVFLLNRLYLLELYLFFTWI